MRIRSALQRLKTQNRSFSSDGAGRICPSKYQYPRGARSFSDDADDVRCDTVYVVGGLYGNRWALDSILDYKSKEEQETGKSVHLLFNGDFNWFNSDEASFRYVNEEAIKGNVEDEIGSSSSATPFGCGCSYPEYVGQGVVDRSNEIIEVLKHTASKFPEVKEFLSKLPMYRVLSIGGIRIGIIHGSPTSLSVESMEPLDTPLRQQLGILKNEYITKEEVVRDYFKQSGVQVFACTHTCLPYAQTFEFALEEDNSSGMKSKCAIINNGAAGMPNFMNTKYGIFTRISSSNIEWFPPDSIYSNIFEKKIRMDAVAIHYNSHKFEEEFKQNWIQGSPAHQSYMNRILNGPTYKIQQAARRGFQLNTNLDKLL